MRRQQHVGAVAPIVVGVRTVHLLCLQEKRYQRWTFNAAPFQQPVVLENLEGEHHQSVAIGRLRVAQAVHQSRDACHSAVLEKGQSSARRGEIWGAVVQI